MELFCKKGFSSISQNSSENTCVGVFSFSKSCRIETCNFIKNRLRHRCFLVNFAKKKSLKNSIVDVRLVRLYFVLIKESKFSNFYISNITTFYLVNILNNSCNLSKSIVIFEVTSDFSKRKL